MNNVTDEMVNRFLTWKLPTGFMPDGGVSFTPVNHPTSWPSGTNLLTATQAREMLEYVVGVAVPAAPAYVPLSDASEEDLYWRLHTLSKMLEQSDIIDGMLHRDAYPAILDAMKAIRSAPITDATYLGLAEDIARLTAEGEKLKLFAIDVLKAWPLGDVGGGDLQEMAVKHGLLVPEKRTAQCCEEGCNCAEYYSPEEWAEGITCYRKAAWLKGMAT